MAIQHTNILLIDSYDSFTLNLAALLRRSIPHCCIYVIKNDALSIAQLIPMLSMLSAIVVGPGPGAPNIAGDIGFVKDLWTLPQNQVIPIFGVCLGMQSMAVEYGATLLRLPVVKHGQISAIKHQGCDLFAGLGEVTATRYHSLHVRLCPDGPIVPLAWADDGADNGIVLMAAKHTFLPFYAVQFHPESCSTSVGAGESVVRNFWRLAKEWSQTHGRRCTALTADTRRLFGEPWPGSVHPGYIRKCDVAQRDVITSIIYGSRPSVLCLCERFGAQDHTSPFVLLDSAAYPGQFTIIGCLTASSLRLQHHIGDSTVRILENGRVSTCKLDARDIWEWIRDFMHEQGTFRGHPDIPFWGGLVGHLSYELGLSSLNILPSLDVGSDLRHPDVNLVLVERSIVMDQAMNRIFVQSILPDDDAWVRDTVSLIESIRREPASPALTDSRASTARPLVKLPSKADYIRCIQQAKEYLYSGDSYELCFTAQTDLYLPSIEPSTAFTSWERYKRLRTSNPAPHSAYIRLYPSTLLSSSPERFLSYSRTPNAIAQLRPMKGTLRKTPGVTREIAEHALARNTKEIAENLMIVDLITHDLHNIVGEDVVVKVFCGVEEYETVWTMVSVIEGKLDPCPKSSPVSGWDVLKSSLPPGSMTGAPKKRSVEILQQLESRPRSIYSGVFGYWCVGGGGDWSVTIRSCFQHADDESRWTVGAGGAITALSDPHAEWEEMVTKLRGVLRAFDADDDSVLGEGT
ncbi:para-aminobenzoate synthase [Fistulina hepatica ATCC 64428]|uniref:aminodeoxychorismate synthase n=1 Tax=Fistulina hepatica ATCC 64428 TaxID=1128425 RepID=A0A0D7ACI5_9AGAR|nr:para-aminobenzoate synthase [Fistulina hepatica ATCC 64428]